MLQPNSNATATSLGTESSASLDLAAAISTSHAFSGEIRLDRLLAKLMQVVIENARAEKCALILHSLLRARDEDGRLAIEAMAVSTQAETTVLQSIPVESSQEIPVSLIHHVWRNQETLALDDATKQNAFAADPYIIQQQPKSILCIPLVNRGKPLGILYLENSLTAGVFGCDRVEVLKLLASQAAISLENARLYERLEDYSRTLEAKVCERTKTLQQEIRYRQQAEEKFALAFRASPNPISISTLADGRYIEVNDSFCRISGYELDEVIGRTAVELNIWANPDDRTRMLQTLQNQGSIRNQECCFRTKSGEVRTMLLSAESIWLDGQECLLSAIADITQRKRVEEELRESEKRFRTLVTQATDSIFVIDPDGKIIDVNQRACDNLGYTRDELLSLSLPHIEQKFTPEIIEEIRRQFALGQIATIEGVHRRKDGTTFPVEVRAGVFESGERQLEIALIRDITERKQAEIALQHAKEAAEVANHAKSEFLANMSHELRTPLNAIIGFTQLMSRDRSLTPSQLDQLNIISRSGEHLLTLINDVLSMAKIESGRTTLNETSFDLYCLIDAIEEMFKLKAQSKDLQLVVEYSPDLPRYVRTDESKLRQVLINLLGNAIKFTQEGRVALRVSGVRSQESGVRSQESGVRSQELGVRSQESGVVGAGFTEGSAFPPINPINAPVQEPGVRSNQQLTPDNQLLTLWFEVSDTGSGIAPTELESLFEPFVQTQSGQQSQQGTGLGLPISRQFVRLMGGEIALSSCLGQGTTFSFDIRVSPADMAEVQLQTPARRVIGLEPNQPQYRILVVEDKWENRHLLVNLLEPLGFELREAENGQEAVEIWETWEPHLIWMDMRMPVMDGYEATKHIKSHLKGQATVVVALTASAFEEARTVVLGAGCDDFVRKPFREDVLFEKMAKYLGVRYVYEEEAPESAISEENPVLEDSSLKQALAKMPPEWVQALYQAALCTDEKQIFALIEEIPSELAPLSNALTDLVNNFRIDKVIDVTQPDSE